MLFLEWGMFLVLVDGNNKKADRLGMSYGKADYKLKKSIMYHLVKESNNDLCSRCGLMIENIDELSIDHVIPWLYSESAKELFYDLNNISFSHLKCNISAARRNISNDLSKKDIKTQLGVSKSTAFARLRKLIMFHLVINCGLEKCCVCKNEILNVGELSVEHKKSWYLSENPVESFFDLNNISFSHLNCNVSTRESYRTGPMSLEEELKRALKSKTGMKCVSYKKGYKKPYQVLVTPKEGKTQYFGLYSDKIEAAKIADEALINFFGKDVITNKKLGLI